jgi:type IV secretion system protein VirB6/type IV secretion system protein TrbL
MSVLMVISIVLLVLVNKIPSMLSSIVGGGAGGQATLAVATPVPVAAVVIAALAPV